MKQVIISCCMALGACCLFAADAYVYDADFSVKDERNRSYAIDVEENTSYAHGHGRVNEGRYEIVVQGNRHFFATPKLADFTLEMDYEIRPYKLEGELGYFVYFRWDREARTGEVLDVHYDKTYKLHVLLNGREVFARQESDGVSFKNRKMALAVAGKKAVLDLDGTKIPFELAGARDGYIGLDMTFSPSETLILDRARITSENAPAKKEIGKWDFVLSQCQGGQEPLRYEVTANRYATGETQLDCRLSGGADAANKRIETGGGEWGRLGERITEPYLRIDTPEGEYRNLLLYRGYRQNTMTLPIRGKTRKNEGWPAEGRWLFRDFPDAFSLAAGYGYYVANPFRFVENGPYEQIRGKDGSLVYEGDSIRGAAIAVKATPPADNATARAIPKDVPRYADARAHAEKGGYFRENETVRFTVETTWRAASWNRREIDVKPRFTTVFDEDLPAPELARRTVGETTLPGGIRRLTEEVVLAKNPGHGVYKLELTRPDASGKPVAERFIFEVLSDDPKAPPAPIVSGLPFFVNMPNEDKYLEQNAFDPWNRFAGRAHYYAIDNQYPAVGDMLQVWRVLPLYNRTWWCQSWNRNTGDYDMYDDWNRSLMRHCGVFGGADNRANPQFRYEFSVLSFYKDEQLRIVRDFVAEKKPPLKRLTLARLNELVEKNEAISFDDLRDLFDTCWEDLLAYARPRIDRKTKEFNDYLWSVNPNLGFASYGPYAIYVARYKTAYTLRYGGYPIEKDPRIRANGSFWVFEDYHHSCDYPVYRPALFVASYSMNYPYGRRIFPEIYTSSWGRCNDGAVFQAHPFPGGRYVADAHQRKVAYTFAYGTPYFKDGQYAWWRDWGFHARNPDLGALDNLVYAWGKMYRNQPVKGVKAPFLMLDLDQIALHGDFFDDQYNPSYWGEGFGDICNSAEEGLAYAYEKAIEAGYTPPVVSRLDELDRITPEMADYVVLPPIVKGTPQRHIDAIRRAYERGVNLLCSETCVGLEDIFGVKEAAAERKVGYVEGESFEHKLALAKYVADGAETVLFGARDIGSARDIPLVMRKSGTARTVFVNLPMACVRKNSFRENYHWGSDSISVTMKKAMRGAFAYLAPQPAVKSERGTATACRTAKDDLVVVVADDSPNYNDTETYPVSFRFSVAVPGIGQRKIESDREYTVVERTDDRIVLRTTMEKDSAFFFKFSE